MQFHEKLVFLRAKHGYTQAALAERVGVSRQSVYKWEKGESYPEAMTLLALRDLFGVSVDALLDPVLSLDGAPAAPVATPDARVAPERQAQTAPRTAEPTEQAPAAPEAGQDGNTKRRKGLFARLFG